MDWALLVHLSFWSMLGALIRIFLVYYPSDSLLSAIYPQMVGCLVLGLLGKRSNHPWFAGLASGLCGSITSFSSFVLGAYKAGLADIRTSVAFALFTIGLSTVSLKYGILLNGSRELLRPWFLGDWFVFVYTLGMVISCVLVIFFSQLYKYSYSVLVAPVGTIIRYLLSRLNRPLEPWGTFSANVIGTVIIGIMFVLEREGYDCVLLFVVQVGFCGSLTTVSTLVMELWDMPLGRAHFYGLGSVLVGLGCMLAFGEGYRALGGPVQSQCV
jgi:CrcB protein